MKTGGHDTVEKLTLFMSLAASNDLQLSFMYSNEVSGHLRLRLKNHGI